MKRRMLARASLVLALGVLTIVPAGGSTCEDCYECNPDFSDDFIEAYCCSGAQCNVWAQEDRCWFVKVAF